MVRHLLGGIGDILLGLEDAISDGSIELYSHYSNASFLVEALGVRIEKLHFYDSLPLSCVPSGEIIPPRQYPKFPLPCASRYKKLDRPILGLHPYGSPFAEAHWKARKYPSKNFTDEAISYLIESLRSKYHIFLFGSEDEIKDLDAFENEDVTLVRGNLWECLATVPLCDAVVAADSSIKAMSALSKIPTYVFMGNYVDHYRDRVFIDPYIRDGVMKVWQYTRYFKQVFQPTINELLSN